VAWWAWIAMLQVQLDDLTSVVPKSGDAVLVLPKPTVVGKGF
jgi:hypothetical protein